MAQNDTTSFNGLGVDEDFMKSGIPMNLGNLDGMQDMIDKMPTDQKDAIGEAFNQEMSSVIDFRLWKKMIDLQKDINVRVAPDWESDVDQSKYDFWMAILDETAEVLGSKQWKWWKDTDSFGEVDWDNVQVELIDIFHFMLSISLQTKQQDSIYMTLMALEKVEQDGLPSIGPVRTQAFFDDFWNDFIMAVWQKSIPLVIVKWVEFWYRSGGTFNTLVRDYFIKNALNHIRQEFGYAGNQGQGYQKMQPHPDDPSKIVEDNVVAGILLKEKFSGAIEIDDMEKMQDILRNYYLEYVAI